MWWVLLSVLAVLLYIQCIKPLRYWKERGIPYQKPIPIVGNLFQFVVKKKSFFEIFKDFYTAFPEERYNGIYQFTKPFLLIRDVDLIKQITVKDFDHFVDRQPLLTEDLDPLMGKNISSLRGQRWRDMRATLSPLFTVSKLRMIYSLVLNCSEQFTKNFQNQDAYTVTVDMKDIFGRFTMDTIATVAFGLKVNSLREKDNEFYLMGKEAMNFSSFGGFVKIILLNFCPNLSKLFGLRAFSPRATKFFRSTVQQTIEERENDEIVRPDMMQLFMEARKCHLKHDEPNDKSEYVGFATLEESEVGKAQRHHKPELSYEDITAQALVFIFGGFESLTNLMSAAAYELAINPDIQKKLQAEIDQTFTDCKGNSTYETILGMPYLDMVVSETLRKWTPGFQIDRICVKDYTIKPKKPNEKPFTIQKDQLLVIPVGGIHYDPKYFPNPDKFDPERFSKENRHNIEPLSYMPFGTGPRSCIASRFALLTVKTIICQLLRKFDVVPVKETVIPLKMGVNSFFLVPDEGFWLGLRERNTCT